MDNSERRRRLRNRGWAFHVPGSLLVFGGLAAHTPAVALAGAVLIAIGFRFFFLAGRVPR
jgi:hypothetical protein